MFSVSLETAVAFVEKMQASDLADMTQDAFDDLMARSLAGHVPPSWEALEKHEWVVLDPQTEATGGDEVEAARARVVGLSCIGCQDEELLIVALRRSFVREGLVIQVRMDGVALVLPFSLSRPVVRLERAFLQACC